MSRVTLRIFQLIEGEAEGTPAIWALVAVFALTLAAFVVIKLYSV